MDLKNDCYYSSIVHKLYNQFEALMVRANDYVWLFNHQGGEKHPKKWLYNMEAAPKMSRNSLCWNVLDVDVVKVKSYSAI